MDCAINIPMGTGATVMAVPPIGCADAAAVVATIAKGGGGTGELVRIGSRMNYATDIPMCTWYLPGSAPCFSRFCLFP